MLVNVHGAVEVWCELSGEWVPGFEAEDSVDEGLVLRRRSDGALLPAPLEPDRVRPAGSGHVPPSRPIGSPR